MSSRANPGVGPELALEAGVFLAGRPSPGWHKFRERAGATLDQHFRSIGSGMNLPWLDGRDRVYAGEHGCPMRVEQWWCRTAHHSRSSADWFEEAGAPTDLRRPSNIAKSGDLDPAWYAHRCCTRSVAVAFGLAPAATHRYTDKPVSRAAISQRSRTRSRTATLWTLPMTLGCGSSGSGPSAWAQAQPPTTSTTETALRWPLLTGYLAR